MIPIDDQARPALAPGVRLHTDKATGNPVVLFPEGLFELNDEALEIVRRCDGRASVADIVAALAVEFDAGADDLRADVVECLGELRERRLIVLKS